MKNGHFFRRAAKKVPFFPRDPHIWGGGGIIRVRQFVDLSQGIFFGCIIWRKYIILDTLVVRKLLFIHP